MRLLLRGSHLVGQYLHPVAANHAAGLEAYHLARLGVAPVGDGHTALGLVDVFVYGSHKLLEGLHVGSHCGSPHNPVGLGIVLAAVKWQTILVLLLQVVSVRARTWTACFSTNTTE